MKQTTRKLFRGCPYKDEIFACEECTKYIQCKQKKKARKSAKRARKVEFILNTVLPSVMTFITAVTAVVALVMCANTASADFGCEPTQSTIPTSYTEQIVGVEDEIATEGTSIIQDVSDIENLVIEENNVAVKPLEEETIPEEYCYNLSKADKILIAKLVWKECRGEPFEGKVAVAAVVLNRFYYGEDKDFNRESIESVVKQPGQFASIQNVSMDDLNKVPECMEAVEAACKGWDPTREMFPQGALYFFAHDKVQGHQKEIREGLKVMVIENHSFHFDFE